MQLAELLQTLCAAAGVNGQRGIAQTVTELVRPLADTVHSDALGNVIAYRHAADNDAPTLLLEAHMDQIGFRVTRVDEKGFVRVAACGGVDRRALPSAEVTVYGKQAYHGVFGSVPPHISKDNAVPEIEEMGIDIGLPLVDVKAAVNVGDTVAFAAAFHPMGEHRVCASSLDNRAGVAAVIQALNSLKDCALPCHVAALFAVKEEVGGHGALAASFGINPTAAVVTDVSFAAVPQEKASDCGVLGGGVMLGYSPVLDAALTERLEKLAAKTNIPWQPEVMGGITGTDADKITVTQSGVPTALLSIPLRYMHTPVEVADLRDIEAVSALMAALAKGGIA